VLLLLVVVAFSSGGSLASAREPDRPINGGKPSHAMSPKDPDWRAGLKRLKARAERLNGAREKRRR